MKIKALKAFTHLGSAGWMRSVAHGSVAEFGDETAQQLISDGLAEEYKLLAPLGEVSITENGQVDVSTYALANVNVPQTWQGFDVTQLSSVTFQGSTATSIDLTGLDISSFTVFSSMFLNCVNLEEVDISSWDTSHITKMGSMFAGCTSLKKLTTGEGWQATTSAPPRFPVVMQDEQGTVYAADDPIPSGAHVFTATATA